MDETNKELPEVRKEIPKDFIAYAETCTRKQVYIDGIGEAKMIASIYFDQDFHAYARLLFSRRSTGEISEQEIKDWQEAWEIIKNIHSYDFQKIKDKYKMQILREEGEPYECWGSNEEFADEVMLQGWLGDPINEENWRIMDLFDRLRLDKNARRPS